MATQEITAEMIEKAALKVGVFDVAASGDPEDGAVDWIVTRPAIDAIPELDSPLLPELQAEGTSFAAALIALSEVA